MNKGLNFEPLKPIVIKANLRSNFPLIRALPKDGEQTVNSYKQEVYHCSDFIEIESCFYPDNVVVHNPHFCQC